jgi:glutathione S-transferase
MTQALPILYSFRRCPYAIRARMALSYAGIKLEHREVFLRNKPRAMLNASAKGTVPVLVIPGGEMIEESEDVMRWALRQQDRDNWWRQEYATETTEIVHENDFVFKVHLDRYKYADRHPQKPQEYYRTEAEKFLQQLESRLASQAYLVNKQLTFSDVAVFPFVRQFAGVDRQWFEQAAYPKLQNWLQSFLESSLFTNVMNKYPAWHESQQVLTVN